jgi:hypothetical protein
VKLRQSCIDEGLLVPALGRRNFQDLEEGMEYVKTFAVVDEEVASALQDALRTPWLERRDALEALVLFTGTARSTTDDHGK